MKSSWAGIGEADIATILSHTNNDNNGVEPESNHDKMKLSWMPMNERKINQLLTDMASIDPDSPKQSNILGLSFFGFGGNK